MESKKDVKVWQQVQRLLRPGATQESKYPYIEALWKKALLHECTWYFNLNQPAGSTLRAFYLVEWKRERLREQLLALRRNLATGDIPGMAEVATDTQKETSQTPSVE